MTRSPWSRLLLPTGVLFVVAFAAGAVIGGETPDSDATGAAVLAFYEENSGSQQVNAVANLLAAALLVLFAATVQRVLADAGANGALSSAVLAGGILAAIGIALMASFQLSLAAAPEEGLDPIGAATLNHLSWNFFGPLQIGGIVLGLAAGCAAVQTRALPVALGWLGVAAGVLWTTPLWFVAGPVLLIWIAATSLVLVRRGPTPELSAG